MDIINSDCLYNISLQLDVNNIIMCMLTNNHNYVVFKNNMIWCHLFFKKYNPIHYFHYKPNFYISYKMAYLKDIASYNELCKGLY